MPRWVPRAIALFFAVAVGLYITNWAVRELRGLLILILVSLFLSFAIEPAVNRLERMGFRRSLGTLMVFAATLVALTLFMWAIGTVVADQFGTFVDEAPGYIEEIQAWASGTLGIEIDTDALAGEFQAGGAATALATRLAGNLVDLGATALGILLQILTVGLFTYYLVADGPRLRRSLLSMVTPRRQAVVLNTWELAIDKTGGYLYSRGLLALASFIAHFIALTLIGVPFPLALALWVGVMSQFIPVIGTYLAGALPILIALLDNPIDALWVSVVVLAYQQVENYVLAPPITAQTMDVHPAVAFGSVLAGAGLLGAVGALLALPAAAVFQAFVSSYLTEKGLRHEVATDAGNIKPRRFRRPPR